MPKDCEVCKRYEGCRHNYAEPTTNPTSKDKYSCTRFDPQFKAYFKKYSHLIKYVVYGCNGCGSTQLYKIDDSRPSVIDTWCAACKVHRKKWCSYSTKNKHTTKCDRCKHRFACFTNREDDEGIIYTLWHQRVSEKDMASWSKG